MRIVDLGLLLAMTQAGLACAQAYPAKPLQLVVPFSAGNAINDTVARLVAPKFAEQIGQPVVINNRPGANGVIGSEQVAKAAPDGYTLLIASPSTHITATYLVRDLPYDALRDFTPLTAAVEPVTVIAVASTFPAQSLRELVELVRSQPGKHAFSSTGIGSVFHLAGESLNHAAGIDMLHVPYKANQQALTDLLAGRISVLLNPVLIAGPQVKGGKMRLLAVMESRRFSAWPDVPAVREVVPGFEKPPSWLGFFGPARLPASITARLNTELVKALVHPDVKTRLEDGGMTVLAGTSEEFIALLQRGHEAFGQVVKRLGLKPE